MTSTLLPPNATTTLAPKPTPAVDAAPLPAILGTYKRQAPLFVRGEGVYMIDVAGKRYLDFVAGIAVTFGIASVFAGHLSVVTVGFAARKLGQMLLGRWHRFGYVCANFGSPISMRRLLPRPWISIIRL